MAFYPSIFFVKILGVILGLSFSYTTANPSENALHLTFKMCQLQGEGSHKVAVQRLARGCGDVKTWLGLQNLPVKMAYMAVEWRPLFLSHVCLYVSAGFPHDE